MGDNTGTKGVTAGELAAVLQAMDEKYKPLFDALSRQQAGGLRLEAEIKEEIHPLQMPLVKLEGSESYASWAEHAETILVSRKLEGYILGTVEKPTEEDSKEGQRWKMTNALVRAWLLSSLSPQIAKQVERIKEASEIWRLLKGTFSGVGNEMLACRIQRELQELSQGEKTVVDYVSQLKRLWSDLDYYDPVEMECGKCVENFHKWTEKRRVRDFLNGLHSKFENRRAALYGSGTLPNLEQAISAILSEETRLNLEDNGHGVHGISQRCSALLATDGGTFQRPGTNLFDKTCFECGQPGHLRVACPQLIGGGRGRGWRARGRGRMFEDRGGRGRGMRHVGRANTSAASEDASQTVSVEMAVDDLEKWRQFKELNIGERKSSEASTSAGSANSSDAYCETGGDKEEEDTDTTLRNVVIGTIPVGDEAEREKIQGEQQEIPNEAPRWPKPNEEREIQVYKRRHKTEEQHVQGQETTSSGHDSEAQDIDSSASSQTPQFSSSYDNTSPRYSDLDVPIAQRKQPRFNAGKLPSK